ncbi:RNA polymerase subunit sigma-54 [Caldalkalibacillus thermarum]|uniref:sigma-54 interaction domain-containing protein n=1 Tax=Caldalkalibacillus thermarum TaxID=296745 RepID=UPI001994ED19|nr:sigma 54-interacting transcriptional regulator [Caldalkalibacillus thermarum]GGK17350.1 RNA polymerase subunit sigma-54 [Caldalkalibacillus thermarum]
MQLKGMYKDRGLKEWSMEEAILYSLQEDLLVTDTTGKIVKVSQACGAQYGTDSEQLIGRNVYDLEKEGVFRPAITPEVLKRKEKVTLVQTSRTGKKLLVTGIPVFHPSGEIVFVVSYSYDVTELIKIKEHLDEMEEEMARVKSELALLRDQTLRVNGLVAESTAMMQVLKAAKKVAEVDVTVLLLGESGVGKSAIARWIHKHSARRDGPFIEVNCSAIPESLFESEFFGYDGGAFTGAKSKGKPGFAELAHGGTLFLDEVGELSSLLQVKLLKFIQEQQFYRVGGRKPISVDIRLIAATNRDLEQAVKEKQFRQDLFFRLNVVPIHIPPLRERPEDVLALIRFFVDKYSRKHGRYRQVDEKVVQQLLDHPWKGNVRELENLIERLVVTSSSSLIKLEDLPENYQRSQTEPGLMGIEHMLAEHKPLPAILEEVEKQLLLKASQTCRTTVEMARMLGISQPSVVRKLKKYGIRK